MMWEMWQLNQERIGDNAFLYLEAVVLDEGERFEAGNNERKLLSKVWIGYHGTH